LILNDAVVYDFLINAWCTKNWGKLYCINWGKGW